MCTKPTKIPINLREIEFEIELEHGTTRREVSVLIHKRDAELDDFEQIHVAAMQLVLVLRIAAEFTDWPGYDAWEFCVLGIYRE